MRFWPCLLWLAASSAPAAQSVQFCYDYGCRVEDWAHYDDAQLGAVRDRLGEAADAAGERDRLALALGALYRWAGEQLPIHADKSGDLADGEVEGRMDCIDHATSTTRLLQMIEAQGWLRHHRVIEPARRSMLIVQHFSAVIEQRDAPVAPRLPVAQADPCAHCYDEAGWTMAGAPAPAVPLPDPLIEARWAVDTWFRDNGAPAVVMPLAIWLAGAYPDD